MARVTGPLMSVDASGSYAGSLVFSKWKGRNYTRQHVIPSNPKSALQTGVRAMMAFLAAQWKAIGATPQGTWAAGAAARAISPFNQYVSANLARWQMNKAPSQSATAAEASTALTITAHTFTGGTGQATLSLTPSAATAIWGFAIYRDTSTITTTSWANCIAIVPANGASAVTHVDSPLTAGTYHYRAAVINTDGKLGTALADDTATVS